MALTPKARVSINKEVSKLMVTDKTGEYNVTTNPGGWGAPNAELDQSAVFAIPVQKHSSGDKVLEAVTNYAVYDSTADNDKETTFDFTYLLDSVYYVYIGRLPVTVDDISDLDSNPLEEGDYVYKTSGSKTKIFKIESGVPVELEVEELLELVESEDVEVSVCESLLFPKLAMERQKLYKEYRKTRDTRCDDAESTKEKMRMLNDDIIGAYYAFQSGLHVEAQTQIEELNRDYDFE
jgi:hypothetical protein